MGEAYVIDLGTQQAHIEDDNTHAQTHTHTSTHIHTHTNKQTYIEIEMVNTLKMLNASLCSFDLYCQIIAYKIGANTKHICYTLQR